MNGQRKNVSRHWMERQKMDAKICHWEKFRKPSYNLLCNQVVLSGALSWRWKSSCAFIIIWPQISMQIFITLQSPFAWQSGPTARNALWNERALLAWPISSQQLSTYDCGINLLLEPPPLSFIHLTERQAPFPPTSVPFRSVGRSLLYAPHLDYEVGWNSYLIYTADECIEGFLQPPLTYKVFIVN